MREILIANGVKNLKEYGYPDCNENNILTDKIYSGFFKPMLEDWIEEDHPEEVKTTAQELLKEIG